MEVNDNDFQQRTALFLTKIRVIKIKLSLKMNS